MNNLNERNEYRHVLIDNIVFLQGDDYLQYEQDNPESDIDYLLQWYYPNESREDNIYNVRDINTAFLGKLIKITGYKGYFLFSKNTSIGYMGLSRIVEFIP